jgi:hypothetical protein
MQAKTDEDKILDIFNNPKTGLEMNIQKLKNKNKFLEKFSNEEIRQVLNSRLDKFQRNNKVKAVTTYRSYQASKVGQLIHIDLMTLNSTRNIHQKIIIDKYKYLLVAVDTHSRYLWTYLLYTKKRDEVQTKIEQLVAEIKEKYLNGDPFNRMHINFLMDGGGEFKNIILDNVTFILSKNKYGAVISEAYIFKIRDKIRLFTDDHAHKVLTVENLQDIIENINNTPNHNLSELYTPEEIFYKMKIPEKTIKVIQEKDTTINVGEYVRIVNYEEKNGRIFVKKSAFNNYTRNIFSVLAKEMDSVQNIWQFELVSIDGTYILQNKFYEKELLPISLDYVKKLTNDQRDDMENFTDFQYNFYKLRKSKESDFKME